MSQHEQSRYEIKVYYKLQAEEVDFESAILIYDEEEKNIVGIRCTTLKAAVARTQTLIRKLKHSAGEEKIDLSRLEKIVSKASLTDRIEEFRERKSSEKNDAWIDEFIEEELIEIVPLTEEMSDYDALWNEYKYRHNLIWKLIFSIIIATTTVIVIPYSRAKIVDGLDKFVYYILLYLPLMVVITAGFAILREIDLLDKIKNTFRKYQRLYFPILLTKKEPYQLKLLNKIYRFLDKIYIKVMSIFNFRMRVIFLLACLLITSVFHIWWGTPSKEETSNNGSSTEVSGSATEELKKIRAILEKGLSVKEQSKANASSSFETHTTDTTYKTGIGLIIVGAIIFASMMLKGSKPSKRMIIATLLSGGVTILSGLSLVNLETFSLITFGRGVGGVNERPEPKGTSINIDNFSLEWPFATVQISGDQNESILFEALKDMGPFEPGENYTDSNKVMDLINEISVRISNKHELIFMIIAGKVDRRPLRKPPQEKYGSNFALAQSRAEWVKKKLLEDPERPGLDPGKLITIATGPEFFPPKNDKGSFEDDRIVRCYALWIKKDQKGGN